MDNLPKEGGIYEPAHPGNVEARQEFANDPQQAGKGCQIHPVREERTAQQLADRLTEPNITSGVTPPGGQHYVGSDQEQKPGIGEKAKELLDEGARKLGLKKD